MVSEQCRKNIEKNKDRMCTDKYCVSISFALDKHCSQHDPPLRPDDPIGPTYDPDLKDYCYCCCSCFSSGTPIEVSPGEFAPARDIVPDETILSAGTDLRWTPRRVESASTWEDLEGTVRSMYLVRYRWDDEGEAGTRDVIVSPDHLFLAEDGTLVAVQNLSRAALRLRRADGGLADVVVVAQGSSTGGVTTIQMAGDFDGSDLTGHLVNTYGLVSSDYKVQVHYASGHVARELVHQADNPRRNMSVGTPEYHEAFPDDAYSYFLSHPEDWPEGFTPTQRQETHIPAAAACYLTDAQARDIRRQAPMDGAENTYRAQSLLYLFNVSRSFYPGVDFLLDWDNSLPNAYTWDQWGRRTVLVTGGLVRLTEMRRDGLAVVLSAMLAYESPEVCCVGEADCSAISDVMHRLWDGDLFVSCVEHGLAQVKTLLSYISAEHARPDPENPCNQPGVACRLDCYSAGRSMFPVPACAAPKPMFFEVRDARALSPTNVQIVFSRLLDVRSAENLDNYAFDPAAEVHRAAVFPDQPNQVRLEVGELAPATTYLVRVSSVVSDDDVPLDPHHATGMFTTK
ncbi:hypothetical protein [Streptomyces sp. NPDC053367]|uniref:hypothetical protein n=1 Tax=Streptomyces sp. NPDC053367 TaxID=3365700 RepID=UPI0037D84820